MTILAIDPGPVQSAYVVLKDGSPVARAIVENGDLRLMLHDMQRPTDACVVEMIASYGMAVGAEVFHTCAWIGRFIEAWACRTKTEALLVTRLTVKTHLCHDSRAKDANIRQALIDRFGGPAAIRKGGPLYKVHGDEWAALAVGVTFHDQVMRQA